MSLQQIDLTNRDALDELFLDCVCYGKFATGYAVLKTGERVKVRRLTWNRVDKMRFNLVQLPFDIGVISESYPVLRQAVITQSDEYTGSTREQHIYRFIETYQELDEHTPEWFIPLEWMKELYLEIGDIEQKEMKS